MYRVGLTGGIASGKSTVAEIFAEHGALVIDADALARYVVEPGMPALEEIRARFGESVLVDGPDGKELDRKALGAIVFADDDARADLNAIIHPRVREVAKELERQVTDPYCIVVHMIPLLVETGQAKDFDALVVVDVSEDVQRERLMARDGLTREQAQARIDAQASRAERLVVADVVVNNDGTLADLAPRADAAWHAVEHKMHTSGGLDCGC